MGEEQGVSGQLVSPVKINLGCGSDILEGYVNVDCTSLPGVDVVHDLDTGPWPFFDEMFVEIRAYDVFEHVNDPLLFMFECGRLLEPDGLLELHVTHWQTENAFTDPTHKRFCTPSTFDYWIPGTMLHSKYGPAYVRGGAVFQKLSADRDGEEIHFILRRI